MPEPAVRELRYDRFRRTIAKRMTESVTTKPQLTLHRHADLTALEYELERATRQNPSAKLGLTAALLVGIARGMASSGLNGRVSDQVIELHQAVHLGVAVDVDGALVVPVIRDAAKLSVEEIGIELRRLADLATTGRLRPDNVDGATFTVTSLGPMGVELFTPIINPPQLAILGVGSIRDEVTFTDGRIASTRRIGFSLSFDHAATDGAAAARVLDDVCQSIEAPEGLVWASSAQIAVPGSSPRTKE